MGEYANGGKMKFSDSHEWVDAKDEIATVGITEHAQKELGEIVFVQLPKVGDKVEAKQEVVILESTKAAADIYSPISGTVVKVNEKVVEDPSLLNSDPEASGWLFMLAASDLNELDALMDRSRYLELIH